MEIFKSTHSLEFMQGPRFFNGDDQSPYLYRIGTCHGLWYSKPDAYVLLMVMNDEIGNGHFTDVMEWFENSCARDKKNFIVAEVWNKRLLKHLIEKRGFVAIEGTENVIKYFL